MEMIMSKKSKLKKVIEKFELGKINIENTLESIFKITEKSVEEYELRNYWSFSTLDDFCDRLLTEPIKDWKNIDDIEAIRLIKEILENITNEGLIEQNFGALEKRYNKVNGFMSNLIFHSELNNEIEILNELKKDRTIYL